MDTAPVHLFFAANTFTVAERRRLPRRAAPIRRIGGNVAYNVAMQVKKSGRENGMDGGR